MKHLITAAVLILLLAGWGPCSRIVRADPVPAQCDALCYVDDRTDEESACASRAKWEGSPADPAEFDRLIYGVVPALRKETWTCGVRLKACQQCLERLKRAKVIL